MNHDHRTAKALLLAALGVFALTVLCFGLAAILENGCLGTAIIAVCVFLYFLCPLPCFGVAVTGLVFARKAGSGRLTAPGITELILFAGWIALAVYSFIGGMSV